MYFHLTDTQVILGGFAFALIAIFAFAAFLDKRWRTAAPFHEFGSDQKPDSLRRSSSRDDKDGSSQLYTRYADLSACGLGTTEERITLHDKKRQNVAGENSSSCAMNDQMGKIL